MPLKITHVKKGSPAHALGMRAGDCILSLNGEPAKDFIDYQFFTAEELLTVRYQKPNGRIVEKQIEKDPYEDFGIDFQESACRACANDCLFCFVRQLPKGMRASLYFKDDDWRMSFLMGNYVTLTNVGEREFSRILRRKISPLYISVHATDPVVRSYLIGNHKNAEILPKLRRLAEAGLQFHCQAVIVGGINDGRVLEKSIADLFALYPYAQSFALVPVGLTQHREGLFPLSPLCKEAARDVIRIAQSFQKKALAQCGSRFVFCSDEMYLRASLPFPSADEYEQMEQKEDGVGMVPAFLSEASAALAAQTRPSRYRHVSIACGMDIAPFLKKLAHECEKRISVTITVYPIENNFFGKTVTVSGLLTGKDLAEQLRGRDLGEKLFISNTALRQFEEVFLDGVTLCELCGILKIDIIPVMPDGYDFIDALMGS